MEASIAVFAISFVLAGQIVWRKALDHSRSLTLRFRPNRRPARRCLPEFINWVATSSHLWELAALWSEQSFPGCTVERWPVDRCSCRVAGGIRITRLIEFWITNGTGGVT